MVRVLASRAAIDEPHLIRPTADRVVERVLDRDFGGAVVAHHILAHHAFHFLGEQCLLVAPCEVISRWALFRQVASLPLL